MPYTYDSCNPERHLWLSVIHGAVLEANGENLFDIPTPRRQQAVDRARYWLTNDTLGLRRACAFAGVSHTKLMALYRKRFKIREVGNNGKRKTRTRSSLQCR